MQANKISSRYQYWTLNCISTGVFGTPSAAGAGAKMFFPHISRNDNPSDIKLDKDAPYLEITDDVKDFPYLQATDVQKPLMKSRVSHDPNVLEDVRKQHILPKTEIYLNLCPKTLNEATFN